MTNKNKLADPWWRLNNLYKIKTKTGDVITFKPNWAQKWLYNNMHYLNIILKVRQLGMTTFIQIFMLDRALFNDNINCGVVAHNKEDAQKFFDEKFKFAYDNLPADLKQLKPYTSSSKRHMQFINGSQIWVSTSLRSGTYQYVHVSEYGKICADSPGKAEEVKTGTLNAVAAGQFVFIESTAEGPFGDFYRMCKEAQAFTEMVKQQLQTFSTMDYKFFFFSWIFQDEYSLDIEMEFDKELIEYFKKLEDEEDIVLTHAQKAWYAKKKVEQGDKMKQEFPTVWREAFERTTEVAIYGKQMSDAITSGRITQVPIRRNIPVNTFWDIGRNDYMAIWFHQHVKPNHHFVHYLHGRLQDLTYYVAELREFKRQTRCIFGKHYLPHDARVTDVSSVNGWDRERILQEAGLTNTVIVPRIHSLNDGIEITRRTFSSCYFDMEGCEIGIDALQGYEWTYDKAEGVTRKTAKHNAASNGADAFRQFAQGFHGEGKSFRDQMREAQNRVGNKEQITGYKRRRGSKAHAVYNPSLDHVV